jgi:ATP-binding cassette subfamily B protein
MSEKNRTPQAGGRPGHGPGPNIALGGAKPKNFKGTTSRLIQYLSHYRLHFLVVILFSVLSATFSIAGPSLLGMATTRIYEGVIGQMTGVSTGIDFAYVGRIIMLLVVLYGLSSLFQYIQGYVMSGVSMKVSYKMRKEISEKIHNLPLRYFDKTNQGEILSRITNDVDTVNQSLNQSMTQMVTSATTVLGVLVMMMTISFKMTLVALAVIPLSMILVSQIVKRSQKYFKEQQKLLGNVNGHIEEMYSGHIVVQAFNGEQKSIDTFKTMNNALYGTSWKAQFLSGLMMPIMRVISNFAYVAICLLGGSLAIQGRISVGDIQAFLQYVRNFTQPISQLANISNVLQQTIAAAERVFEFLDEEDEIAEVKEPVETSGIAGLVHFEHVHFGYDPLEPIINDFSVEVVPGQKVAIVGPTGAGKTTMVKLLMRFYDVQSGEIRVDNIPITHYRRADLRRQFGMVLQDTWLSNTSILENIRYGRLDATDEDVYAAAKAANVDSFVHMLPEGYQMVLNEDATNISQGQKQLITIARAMLADPKILILDEATSSVDTRTEVQIQSAMNTLMQGRTAFIIAHRLSTIRDADIILVMNHGDIVEQGTHQALLAQKGFYANLYNSQFEE